MLQLIAQVLRYVIIALVQSAVFIAAMNLLEPVINALKKTVQERFGLNEEDSGTYVANTIIDILELTGLTVLSLKSKFPLKIADKLGLTSRGWKRGALPAAVSTGPNAPGAVAKAALAGGVPTATAVAQVVAKGKGISFDKIDKGLNVIFKAASIPVGFGFLISAAIDWAAWDGSAYQNTFQKIFAVIGLKPDAAYSRSKVLSPEVFDKILATYQNAGAYAISDPFKMQTVVFSKQALIDLLDKVGSQLLLEKGSASTKDVLAATTALVLIRGASSVPPSGSRPGGSTGSVGIPSKTPSQATLDAIPKVFTGIVSQGSLGNQDNFTPRPDDLITDADDLAKAAANNLTPFLAALPGRVRYEIKIVPSYIDRNGFTHRGTTQRIQTGTYANGTPKYKTITNKFAVANMYILTSKGSRTKLDMIVLGPVDSGRFQPTGGDVEVLVESLQSGMTKSYTSAVREDTAPPAPEKDEVIEVEKEKYTNQKGEPALYVVERVNEDGSLHVVWRDKDSGAIFDDGDYFADSETFKKIVRKRGIVGYEFVEGEIKEREQRIKKPKLDEVEAAPEPTGKPGASATTLYEWYQAQGESLPSLASRATIYEELGLGVASFYTGTAEQNTKLLAALKAQ